MTQSLIRNVIFAALTVFALSMGVLVDTLNFRTVGYALLGLGASLILFLPMTWCISILFLYIGVEGCAKMMTNYNPIVHVGADLIIVFLWTRSAIHWIAQRKLGLPQLPPLTYLFGAHLIWFLITVLNPYALSLFASLAAAKLYITVMSLYFFGYYLTKDVQTARSFFIPWIIVGIAHGITGMYQSSVGPSSVTSLSSSYAFALIKYKGTAFRPFGLGQQPGTPAVFAYLSIPFALYFIFFARSRVVPLVLLFSLPLTAAILFVCQIRSALLKALINIAGSFFVFLSGSRSLSAETRRVIYIGISTLLICSLVLIPYLLKGLTNLNEENQRAVERSLSLFSSKVAGAREGAMDRFIDYTMMAPLGAGLSRMGSAAGKFQDLISMNRYFTGGFFSDNLWIELVVDLGIPGMIIYTLLLIMIMAQGSMNYWQECDPQNKILQGIIIVSLFSILVGAYGAEPILYNPEASFFWFFSGVLLRLGSLGQKSVYLAASPEATI